MKIRNIITESLTSTDLYEVLYLYAHEQYVHFMIPFYFHLNVLCYKFQFQLTFKYNTKHGHFDTNCALVL